MMKQELEEVGYRIREAVDGFDAISQVQTNPPPDLIVLDVLMPPGINGFDVVTTLRTIPATSAIPIIMLSILDDRVRGKQVGANDYLTKPVCIEELIHSIDRLLKSSINI